jgi:hypothetical protein
MDFEPRQDQNKAGMGCMQFFMILAGFIRVVTAKEADPTNRVPQSFRHNIARLLARFCPAYYLALTFEIVQHGESVSILAPLQALFIQAFSIEALDKKIGSECVRMYKEEFAACFAFFGHSWFVADIFVLVAMFPLWDLIPKMIQKCWARVLLLFLFRLLVRIPLLC